MNDFTHLPECAKKVAGTLLRQAENVLINERKFVAATEPFALSGDRYRRTAYKLSFLNAQTIDSWQKSNAQEESKIDVIDMFCGCGGMSVGFHALNRFIPAFRIAGALDIDPYSCQTYEKNLDIKPHQIDIKKLGDYKSSGTKLQRF